jgi:phosphoribosylaminoimidazole-succinocarboxamide synthase
LASIVPNHFVTDKVEEMPDDVRQYKDQLDGRAMLVRKATVVPLEAIVRGYLTGACVLVCNVSCVVGILILGGFNRISMGRIQ